MRSVPSRALASLALFAVARDALACPTCMSGNDKNVLFLKVGALLSLVPFAVVALVLWVLRKAAREEEREEEVVVPSPTNRPGASSLAQPGR